MIEIVDDTQYEPNEQFYLKLSFAGIKATKNQDVSLGRISIMEITILNDDGSSIWTNKLIINILLNALNFRSMQIQELSRLKNEAFWLRNLSV